MVPAHWLYDLMVLALRQNVKFDQMTRVIFRRVQRTEHCRTKFHYTLPRGMSVLLNIFFYLNIPVLYPTTVDAIDSPFYSNCSYGDIVINRMSSIFKHRCVAEVDDTDSSDSSHGSSKTWWACQLSASCKNIDFFHITVLAFLINTYECPLHNTL